MMNEKSARFATGTASEPPIDDDSSRTFSPPLVWRALRARMSRGFGYGPHPSRDRGWFGSRSTEASLRLSWWIDYIDVDKVMAMTLTKLDDQQLPRLFNYHQQ